MNSVTLTKKDIESFVSFVDYINLLIKSIKEAHLEAAGSATSFYNDFQFCLELRKNRKSLYKTVKIVANNFPNFSEKKQVELELLFFNKLKELKSIVPELERELKEDSTFIFFRIFLVRELKKTIKMFAETQQEMGNQLYPDNTAKILADPDLQKKLADTWADEIDY